MKQKEKDTVPQPFKAINQTADKVGGFGCAMILMFLTFLYFVIQSHLS